MLLEKNWLRVFLVGLLVIFFTSGGPYILAAVYFTSQSNGPKVSFAEQSWIGCYFNLRKGDRHTASGQQGYSKRASPNVEIDATSIPLSNVRS